jgi:4,5-DOPA dioxygenase extradiol
MDYYPTLGEWMPVAKAMPKRESYSHRMPVLFVGHGSPMNAIEDNEFSRRWKEVGSGLPRPNAILCISAHWETRGTRVTAMRKPRTIHDFYGFPEELYAAEYAAPGSELLAGRVKDLVTLSPVGLDRGWGLDHGCWSVLGRMFPDRTVPVIQLSLDYTKPSSHHYLLAKELAPLRDEGVLVVGSGNMVHNLRLVQMKDDDFNGHFGFDWALEANELIKKLIVGGRHGELIGYDSLGGAVRLAVPTPEHYLPMLYALAMRQEDEPLSFFNDVPVAGSLTMTSFVIG